MSTEFEKKKILITVKTYPMPSATHQELVCTAGVLENGSFIRLYPISFRYQPYWQWYKKYQWIEVLAKKNEKDPRKESWRPKPETIKVLGKPIQPGNYWTERKKYVLAAGVQTMEELEEARQANNTSLGIIKPAEITDLIIEPTETEWKPPWKEVLAQNWLLGPRKKPLERIPFRFSYTFRCNDPRCRGHKMIIEDWEVGQLYRTMRDKYDCPEKAAQKVKQKFFDQMCAEGIDTHFFVGTVLAYGTWIILGVFWPKKVLQ